MVKITYIEHSGEQVSVEAAPGLSIMKAAVNADVAGIVAECGGNAACGTCRIYVDDAWRAKLPPPRQSEQEMLDYTGDAATLGKNVGDDLAEGKPTLPLIYAMRTGTAAQAEVIAAAIRNGDASQLPAILEIVQATGGMTYTLDCAKQQVEDAITQLAQLPDNRFTQAMKQLAEFSLARSF